MNWKNIFLFILILVVLVLTITIIKTKYDKKQEDMRQSTLPEAVRYLYEGQVEGIYFGQPWGHRATVMLKNGQSIETSDSIGLYLTECRKIYSHCEEVAAALP